MSISIIEEHIFSAPPEKFFDFITNPFNMTTWVGYGPVPAIEKITPLTWPDRGVGASYRVENSDGSSHEESVIMYDRPKRFHLAIGHFLSPFRFFIDRMEEDWQCEPKGRGTRARRTFILYPTATIVWSAVWLMGQTLWRQAIRRNHGEIEKKLQKMT